MFEIKDLVLINCNKQQVYNKLLYYFKSTNNYKEWHKDHISCKWIKGSDFSIGSILSAKEILHNTIHQLSFKIIKANIEDGIEYKVLFPFTILKCYGYFNFKEKGNKTIFIAGLRFGINPVFRKLFTNQINSLLKHIKEEGISLKYSIEKDII